MKGRDGLLGKGGWQNGHPGKTNLNLYLIFQDKFHLGQTMIFLKPWKIESSPMLKNILCGIKYHKQAKQVRKDICNSHYKGLIYLVCKQYLQVNKEKGQ